MARFDQYDLEGDDEVNGGRPAQSGSIDDRSHSNSQSAPAVAGQTTLQNAACTNDATNALRGRQQRTDETKWRD